MWYGLNVILACMGTFLVHSLIHSDRDLLPLLCITIRLNERFYYHHTLLNNTYTAEKLGTLYVEFENGLTFGVRDTAAEINAMLSRKT